MKRMVFNCVVTRPVDTLTHIVIQGGGVTGRVKNKSGVTKGGQNVLLGNVNIISTHVYMHRQMIYRKPPDWKVMGDIEVENIMEYLNPMI